MKSRLLLLIGLVVLGLLLASCRFVAQTQIQPDGSGVLREAHVYDKTEGETPQETCQKASWHSQPGEATFTEEVHQGQVYCVRSRSFSSLQELKQFYTAWNGQAGVQVSIKKLQLDKGQFSLDVTLDVSNIFDTENTGIYEVQLTPPGTLKSSNAPQKNGQKLIWTVYPRSTVTMQVESVVASPTPASTKISAPQSSVPQTSAFLRVLDNSSLLLIAGLLLLLVCVFGGGAVLFLRRRRRSRRLEQQVAWETRAQRQHRADAEEHDAAQIHQQIADLFKNRYSQAATDLDAIVDQITQIPGLSTSQKEALLEQIGELYLKNLDHRTAAAYEALLVELLGTSPQDAGGNTRRSDRSG